VAQPPAYERGPNLISYAGENPAAPYNPAFIEAELNNIMATLSVLLANILTIQRDDTKLANGSVHPDAFSSSALLLLAAGAGSPKGPWVTATLYEVGDLVEQTGQTYVSLVDHLSGVFATDLAAVKWMAFKTPGTAVTITPPAGMTATTAQAAVDEFDARLDAQRNFARDHALGVIAL